MFSPEIKEKQKKYEKTLALLDVDQTLILTRDVKSPTTGRVETKYFLNEELIHHLLASGVTECYLFTDMSLNDISEKVINPEVISRLELIEKLQEKGISVLGVITGADPNYSPIPGEPFKNLYLPQYQRWLKGELTYDDIENHCDDEFEKCKKEMSHYLNLTRAQCEHTQVHIKYAMYHHFITHLNFLKLPTFYNTLLFCDDNIECVDAVIDAHHAFASEGKEIELKAIHISKKANEPTNFNNLPSISLQERFSNVIQKCQAVNFYLDNEPLQAKVNQMISVLVSHFDSKAIPSKLLIEWLLNLKINLWLKNENEIEKSLSLIHSNITNYISSTTNTFNVNHIIADNSGVSLQFHIQDKRLTLEMLEEHLHHRLKQYQNDLPFPWRFTKDAKNQTLVCTFDNTNPKQTFFNNHILANILFNEKLIQGKHYTEIKNQSLIATNIEQGLTTHGPSNGLYQLLNQYKTIQTTIERVSDSKATSLLAWMSSTDQALNIQKDKLIKCLKKLSDLLRKTLTTLNKRNWEENMSSLIIKMGELENKYASLLHSEDQFQAKECFDKTRLIISSHFNVAPQENTALDLNSDALRTGKL